MNKIRLHIATILFGLVINSLAFAAVTPSFYIGGQLGWGDTNYTNRNIDFLPSDVFPNFAVEIDPSTADVDSDGFAGRIYIGYQDNQHFAYELGFTHFSKTDIDDIEVVSCDCEFVTIDGEIDQSMIDLSMKFIFPLTYGFNFYGRGGKCKNWRLLAWERRPPGC